MENLENQVIEAKIGVANKVSRKSILVMMLLSFVVSVFSWVGYVYSVDSNIMSDYRIVCMPIFMTSLTVLLFVEFLTFKRKIKIIRFIGFIFLIPLIPVIIIATFSQTKFGAALTLPMMVLCVLIPLSTYSYQLLEFLHLGSAFNNNVIPYLNLTTITVTFIYSDKYLVKFLAKVIPEDQMPYAVKEATYELIDDRFFIKIAYMALTLLFIISTIENLGQRDFINFLDPYKSVALQSLVTFAAVDRLVSKWKR